MIPAECHLQGQLFTLIKCPELLGQICWTVKQKSLSHWWLISPGLLGGDGIFLSSTRTTERSLLFRSS